MKQHVRDTPEELRYCPTPNWPQVHRIWRAEGTSPLPGSSSAAGQESPPRLVNCEWRGAIICLRCETVSHEELSRGQQERLSAKATEALTQGKGANQNHVRDCPKCGKGIDTDDGCAHMQCCSWQQHFCWNCLRRVSRRRRRKSISKSCIMATLTLSTKRAAQSCPASRGWMAHLSGVKGIGNKEVAVFRDAVKGWDYTGEGKQ